jgi:hypothetical protein
MAANGSALHVVKGIPPYNAMILRGWQFSVDATGKVIGAKDLRTYGGVSAGSLQPSALNAFKIQNAGDFSGTAPGAGTDGYVITWVESADAFELQPLSTVGFEIEHAADFGGTAPGAGNDGYVVTWSNTEHYFELLPAPGGSPLPITFGTAVPNPSAITETGQMYLRTNQATPAPDGIVFIAAGVYAEPETPTQLSHTPTQLLRFIETSGSVATDATANSHNGTFTNVGYGTTPLVADAPSSIEFTGSSYCATNFQIPTAAFTIEIFASSNCGNNQRLFANGHTDDDNTGVQIRMGTSAITIDVGVSGGRQSWSLGGAFESAQHIVVTYDGSNIKIYLNGALQITWTNTYTPGNTMPAVGYNPNYGGDYWTGLVNNFAVYSTALTADQVLADYNAIGHTGASASWSPIYVGEPTLASDTDIDQTTVATGKTLSATPSGGKPFSWITPSGGGTLASLTDIDQTTAGAGKVLTDQTSGGKTFSFQTPSGGGGGGGGGVASTPLTFSGSTVSKWGYSAYPSNQTIAGISAGQMLVVKFLAVPTSGVQNEFGIDNGTNGYSVSLDLAGDGNVVTRTQPGDNGLSASGVPTSGANVLQGFPNIIELRFIPKDSGNFGFSAFVNGFPVAMTVSANGTAMKYLVTADILGGTWTAYSTAAGTTGSYAVYNNPLDYGFAQASVQTAKYDTAILAESSLVHYWPLNELSGAPVDHVGTGTLTLETGTYQGAAALGPDGEASVMMDGSGGGILGANSLVPNLGTGPWAIEFVGTFIGYTGSQGTVFVIDGTNNGPYLYLNVGSLSNSLAGYNGSTTTANGNVLGSRCHFVINVSGNVLSLYVNGAFYLSQTVGPASSGNFSIGSNGASSQAMHGLVAKLAIYNNVLSLTQIAAHVTALNAGGSAASGGGSSSNIPFAVQSNAIVANSPGVATFYETCTPGNLLVCSLAKSAANAAPTGWTSVAVGSSGIQVYSRIATGVPSADQFDATGFGSICGLLEEFANATSVYATTTAALGGYGSISSGSISLNLTGPSEVRALVDGNSTQTYAVPTWGAYYGAWVGGRQSSVFSRTYPVAAAACSFNGQWGNGNSGSLLMYAVK